MSLPNEVLAELMAYADGELDPEGTVRIEALLATNEEARAVVASFDVLGAAVRAAEDRRARRAGADGASAAVLARIVAEEHGVGPASLQAPLSRTQPRAAAWVVTASALAIAAGVALMFRSAAPEPQQAREPSDGLHPSEWAAYGNVDVEDVDTARAPVDVFFIAPTLARAAANVANAAQPGQISSVVVWIGDDGDLRRDD